MRSNAKLTLTARGKPLTLYFSSISVSLLPNIPPIFSFEFGTMTQGGPDVCRLFTVAAASVPAPGSGQNFAVYDIGCSV